MKFTKLDLLTLLISLFLFSSCKDSSSIGLDVDPANAVSGTLLDTVTVTSRTVKDEATETFYGANDPNNPTRYPLGMMSDAIFGSTTASLAMSVNLPGNTATSFSTTPVTIDSAVLVLAYSTDSLNARAREFYGDSTANYNITVSQLTENLSTQSSWLSTKNYASVDVLGTRSGPARPNTKVKVTSIVTGGADTAVVRLPQIRIRLNTEMIRNKIAALDSLTLTTNARFNAAFKGLKVTATTTGTGGIMFLNLSGTASPSNLEIYYRQQNATTTTQTDTIYKAFPITTATNAVAATVTHDYTNTPVAAQINTPGDYQVTYLQAMSGIRNRISFPYLKNLTASLGSKIVINKAELVIDSSDPADSIPFKIPPRLAMYRLDIAGQRQLISDGNPYSSPSNTTGDSRTAASGVKFDGFYRFVKTGYLQNSYSFNITNYVQDLLDGKIVDYGTFLAPIATDVTSVGYINNTLTSVQNVAPVSFNYAYPAPTSAGRVIIGSFNNTNNRKIRLNIYYVKTTAQ